MLRSPRLLAIPLIAAGLLLVCGANEAKAQVRVQIGGFGFNGGGLHRGGVYRGGNHFSSNRIYGYSTRRYSSRSLGHNSYYTPRIQTYGHRGHGFFHDTSHYDFHPGGYYPHGNHWDYQPGHFDFHRSGHFHH